MEQGAEIITKKEVDELPLKGKKRRCPYCGREVTYNKKNSNNKEYCYPEDNRCSHNFIYNYLNLDNLNEVKINSFSDMRQQYEKNDFSCDVDEVNRIEYPENFESGKSAVISLIGVSQSGKSTFISNLFDATHGNGCNYLKDALFPYASRVELYKSKPREKACFSEKWLLQEYSARPYEKFVSMTSNDDKMPIITRIPYVMSMDVVQLGTKKAYLSFFDAPGGCILEQNEDIKYTMAPWSDCLILLINGTPKTDSKSSRSAGNNKGASSISLKEANSILCKILEKLTKSGIDKIDDKALAVVLCQFDVFADYFDENSYVRITPPEAKSHRYRDSLRQRYIDKCSDEVESFIKNKGGSDGDTFCGTVEKFTHRKFFAVSSIGRSDCIKQNKDSSNTSNYTTLFNAKPFNIENVILWIMYQTEIIK